MNLGYLISSQISLIAQHDSSRLGFPALITALCKARGVTSDSLTFESLSPAINLAYVKKNCWNLDDPSVTFWGTRKSRGKGYEVTSSSAPPSLLLLHLSKFIDCFDPSWSCDCATYRTMCCLSVRRWGRLFFNFVGYSSLILLGFLV